MYNCLYFNIIQNLINTRYTNALSQTRQLNIWGFKSYGRDGWINANFVRGNVKGLKFVQRVQAKSSSGDSSSTTTDRKSPALSPPRSGGEASSNSGVDPPPDVSTSKYSSPRVLAASSHRQERTPDNSTQQQSEDDYFLSMGKILGLKDDTADECRCSFCRALKIGADWASISRLNEFWESTRLE